MDMMSMVSSLLAMQAEGAAAADCDVDDQIQCGCREIRGPDPAAAAPSTANLAAGVGGNLNITA